jgi:hypothetical protein
MKKKTRLVTTFTAGFIVSALFLSMFFVSTRAVSADSISGPVIDSVSPILAIRLQTIVIRGSGFGNTQPQLTTLDDGSVATVVGNSTPVIRIYDVDGWDSWEAGCEDSQWVPKTSIGIYLTSWSDTEIVLDGFGTALNVNSHESWNIKAGDPLIVNVQTASGQAACPTTVVASPSDIPNSGMQPVISSVSPISTARLQTISIHGSGFGNTQPRVMELGDGSVDTVGGGTSPVIRIYDQNGYGSWQAGVQDNPNSGADSIGIVLVSWSDTEIVLGGFGAALGTNGQGEWSISSGDQLLIAVLSANGQATYTTTVVASQPDDTPIPASTSTPVIAVACRSSATTSSFRVEINGSLTYNGAGLQDLPVLLSYSVDGGNTWNQLTLVKTDDNGAFFAVWLPAVTGEYSVKATWVGDNKYTETTATVDFAVLPSDMQDTFPVATASISLLALVVAIAFLMYRKRRVPKNLTYRNNESSL